jgi:hypothetical protein
MNHGDQLIKRQKESDSCSTHVADQFGRVNNEPHSELLVSVRSQALYADYDSRTTYLRGSANATSPGCFVNMYDHRTAMQIEQNQEIADILDLYALIVTLRWISFIGRRTSYL